MRHNHLYRIGLFEYATKRELKSMRRKFHIYGILLAIMLLTAAWRVVGLDWDNYAATHPDERFVATITAAIGDKDNLRPEVVNDCSDNSGGFFDTACSVWNPTNVNSGSFAYGTLPVFMVHTAAEVLAKITDNRVWQSSTAIPLVGRGVNVFADMLSILFIFLIGRRLFGETQGLLAAMLYAGAVLPIQLAHFWTVDTISHLFFIIALYYAVIISQTNRTWAYLLFGVAMGAAIASRANLLVAAILAPVAAAIYLSQHLQDQNDEEDLSSPLLWGFTGKQLGFIALKLFAATFVGFWVFRIAQPYAFNGPGFFDVIGKINFTPSFVHLNWNLKWRRDLAEVANLASHQSDGWPPSHQWVGRLPYLYPWFNWLWGMGLSLWLIGTAALLIALYRQLVRRQLSPQVGLLSVWFVLYFGWQGQLHFMTLRYYLPLYAVLGLLAAWWVSQFQLRWRRLLQGVLVAGTFFWAFAFTGIYRSPQTRAEAAYWMRDNIPAMVNGRLPNGEWIPLGLAYDQTRGPAYDMITVYQPRIDGQRVESRTLRLEEPTRIENVWFHWTETVSDLNFSLQLRQLDPDNEENRAGILWQEFTAVPGSEKFLQIEPAADNRVTLPPGLYRWELSVNWSGTEPALHLIVGANPVIEWLDALNNDPLISPVPLETTYDRVRYYSPTTEQTPLAIEASQDITLTQLYLVHQIGPPTDLIVELPDGPHTAHYLRAEQNSSLLGEGRYYQFDSPITLKRGINYLSAAEPTFFTGTAVAGDGDWEDASPARICWNDSGINRIGYIPFSQCRFYGAYDRRWLTEVRLQVVMFDSDFKARFMQDVLEKADYIAITTNRMYDALPRNSRFFWYTGTYYDALFAGDLGFEEIARFESFPRFGFLTIPDQVLPDSGWPRWLNGFEAEEAFTVYDHPTTYVFKKTDFTPNDMPPFAPRFDERNRIDLAQQPIPTYVEPETAPSDDAMWRTVAIWAVAWMVLAWLAFPLVYSVFPALPLRGFMFGQVVAWLLLSLIPWWLTAVTGLPLWRREALMAFLLIFIGLNGFLAWRKRAEFLPYLRQHWRALLAVQVLWLAAFAFGVVLRGVNPDMWHPNLGGERQMDLAYLHATLRAESFPPPNPWMSGFSINYYYIGFIIMGMPLKLFAIAPEIAPNLVLATLYATIFTTVAGLVSALVSSWQHWFPRPTRPQPNPEDDQEVLTLETPETEDSPLSPRHERTRKRWRFALIVAGTAFIMLGGTYGTLQRMIEPEENMADHRWYWYPTRIIAETQVTFRLPESEGGGLAVHGGEIINEFPVFSFLYGDPHAHTVGLLPVLTLLMLLWVFVNQRNAWLMPLIGATLGVIFMTNVWDILVYAPLVGLFVLYILITTQGRTTLYLLGGLLLGGLIMVAPYVPHFTTDESASLKLWKYQHTPLQPFLLVWGAPMMVVAMWVMNRAKALLVPEADFPVEIGMVMLLAVPVFAADSQSQVTMLVGLLLVVSLLLAFFDRSIRYIHLASAFFLAGLIAIDYVTINDDRMNTGFKVSYQLWLLAGLLMPVILYHLWTMRQARLQVFLCLAAIAPTLLFAVKAVPARHVDSFTDRFTLNGYDYMRNMEVAGQTGDMLTVSDDLDLIRYMRSHLTGYPVIAEGYLREYYWNGRIASYTGLPSVIGWQSHLRQQFPHQPNEISQRVEDMFRFYAANNLEEMRQFISLYHIQYIVSGTLEQAIANGRHVGALEQLVVEGTLSIVYEKNSTRLYQVMN